MRRVARGFGIHTLAAEPQLASAEGSVPPEEAAAEAKRSV